METYMVETIRAGQPRPYADTEDECRITIKQMAEWGPNKGEMVPWVAYGDVEEHIRRDEADRAAGRLLGGEASDEIRKRQKEWAKRIVRTLFKEFREAGDDDGVKGPGAYFFPTLKWIRVDASKGQITALIVTPYSD